MRGEPRQHPDAVHPPGSDHTGYSGSRLFGPGGVELRLDSREIAVGGATRELTPQEFAVLRLLLEHADAVVTADELAEGAWGHPLAGNRSFLDSLISRLRSDLRQLGVDNLIRTVRGIGYRIPMPVQAPGAAPALPGLIESIRTAVILLDRDRKVAFANGAAESLTGYRRGELQALPTVSLLSSGEDVPYWEQLVDDCFGGESRNWSGATIRQKDGTHVSACITLNPADSTSDSGFVTGAILELHCPPPGTTCG